MTTRRNKQTPVSKQKFSATIEEATYIEMTVIAARRKLSLSELLQLVSAEFIENSVKNDNSSVS